VGGTAPLGKEKRQSKGNGRAKKRLPAKVHAGGGKKDFPKGNEKRWFLARGLSYSHIGKNCQRKHCGEGRTLRSCENPSREEREQRRGEEIGKN